MQTQNDSMAPGINKMLKAPWKGGSSYMFQLVWSRRHSSGCYCSDITAWPLFQLPLFRNHLFTVTLQMFATVPLSPVTYTYCWRGLNQLSCNFNDAVLELTRTFWPWSGSEGKQRRAAKILIFALVLLLYRRKCGVWWKAGVGCY